MCARPCPIAVPNIRSRTSAGYADASGRLRRLQLTLRGRPQRGSIQSRPRVGAFATQVLRSRTAQSLNQAPITIEAVGRTDALFAIDREINRLAKERLRMRKRPLIAVLKHWLARSVASSPPGARSAKPSSTPSSAGPRTHAPALAQGDRSCAIDLRWKNLELDNRMAHSHAIPLASSQATITATTTTSSCHAISVVASRRYLDNKCQRSIACHVGRLENPVLPKESPALAGATAAAA